MSVFNTITLLFNGLTLALALGFLLIVLWQDVRKEINQFFGIFLLLVVMWNTGSLLVLSVSLIDASSPLIHMAVSLMELGFTGASIAIYALTAVLVGMHTRRFRILAFTGLLLVLSYQIFLIVNNAPQPVDSNADGVLRYRFQSLSALFYFMFDGMAFYLIWRYRRKIRSGGLVLGLNMFVVGQSLGFLNPDLQLVTLSANLCSLATLIISFSILRQEIITPLAERIQQAETIHKVSLAVTSQIAIDTVLNQIAIQACDWLGADASGIFLTRDADLELVAVYNLPPQFVHSRIQLGQGVVGKVAQTRQSVYLENYGRDWQAAPDMPLANETFGSVISVPLIYGNSAIGVLMVIAGRHGRLFYREAVQLLEFLGAQAAVAISHSQLFAEQHELARQVELARSQLETVLVSTENPVVAVDRHFRLIFANPAARLLFPLDDFGIGFAITKVLPSYMLPGNYRAVLRDLRSMRTHTYEVSLGNKIYLCHLTSLGRPRADGWVAVLNDVTQLKELDRLKSEMVRMTSHDLKNPLQAALANLDLLSDDLLHIENPDVHQSIGVIEAQLIRMNRIIGGILDLERVKSGTLSMGICSPIRVITNVAAEMSQPAKDKGVRLEVSMEDNLPFFWGDAEQFERALINLVENGIKFTPRGGIVVVRARGQDDRLIFEVQDTGIGIAKDLQVHIFERFFRGEQKGQKGAEHISGSGLGLSLVKAIVENHHGRIWLESGEGQGTTFFVSIPIKSEVSYSEFSSHSQ